MSVVERTWIFAIIYGAPFAVVTASVKSIIRIMRNVYTYVHLFTEKYLVTFERAVESKHYLILSRLCKTNAHRSVRSGDQKDCGATQTSLSASHASPQALIKTLDRQGPNRPIPSLKAFTSIGKGLRRLAAQTSHDHCL